MAPTRTSRDPANPGSRDRRRPGSDDRGGCTTASVARQSTSAPVRGTRARRRRRAARDRRPTTAGHGNLMDALAGGAGDDAAVSRGRGRDGPGRPGECGRRYGRIRACGPPAIRPRPRRRASRSGDGSRTAAPRSGRDAPRCTCGSRARRPGRTTARRRASTRARMLRTGWNSPASWADSWWA